MRAIVMTRHGRPEVLEVREVPDPIAKTGEVRIQVKAAGLNFAAAPAPPGPPPAAPTPPRVGGAAGAGTTEARGAGVTGFNLGDRVWALTRFGGHAELAVTPASLVRKMNATLSFEQAAAVPVVYATATLLVRDYGHVFEGDRVLIHMAAGGVGLAAIQLCKQIPGVTLFGTASASKHAFLRAQGLQYPIDYRTTDYAEEVRRLTEGRGVHLILDPMGGENWKKNHRLLAPLGRLMVFGFSAAQGEGTRNLARAAWQLLQSPRWGPLGLMDRNQAVMGLNLGHLFGEGARVSAGLDSLARDLDRGVIRPVLDQVFPFSKAADAHRRIESRANVGKIVLVPDGA